MKTANPIKSWAMTLWVAAFLASTCEVGAQPLVSLEYKITGTQLTVSPAALSVPKGIPGSFAVNVVTGDTNEMRRLTNGAYVEAILHGPGIDARRVVGAANTPLLLPPLNLVGD